MIKQIFILLILSIALYAADCDKPKLKLEKDGGCKIEMSENLVICLIDAKTKKDKDICLKKEKENNCKKISEKFSKIKNIFAECNFFYSDKKINCLLKKEKYNNCNEIDNSKIDSSKINKKK